MKNPHSTTKTWLAAWLIAGSAALPAFAADNPWVGTWKLNKAKSHLTGQTFVYSKNGNGLDHFSDGATEYDFTANGIDYPVMGGATESWTSAGQNIWTVTDKMNSQVVTTSKVELSKDCKTMKVTTMGTRPDGSAINDQDTYTKIKPDGCLEGTWKSMKVTSSEPGMWIVSQNSPDEWKWEIPDWKETLTGKPDGSDLTVSGPDVATGMTVAIKQDGPRKLTYTVKQNGKALGQGEQTLAANGKSFTDQSWVPGKETEKQTSVYEKQ
jgi:hypothetical protein